ncbi:succinyl-CoA:acetate CoA-transferase [Bryocella elongata]|uniref:Succinyl-CoA:acetate CoA-transferase n=1 Tax=Bryocella elongata TaxID=863522 RepID=A0A1H5UUB7_9BACT|nr:acetyl-CoA hydrolase/transferase C-terminal domain-containing protein [Bryocella elongata]SEF78732.1 succinyl-CoA:acetate CoA-transferase [Bryocella elongata]
MSERIRYAPLAKRVVSAEEASLHIQDGMRVGMSGFTRAGDAKRVLHALANRLSTEPIRITLLTGASLGYDTDKVLAESGILTRRLPFQVDTTLRRKINAGEVMFVDQHLGETAEQLRSGSLPPVDIAVLEAVAITEQGHIVPTTSVGNSMIFAQQAKKIIVEINHAVPAELEGLHDLYQVGSESDRGPIAIRHPGDRIGAIAIPVDPSKIVAIVSTNHPDSPAKIEAPDVDTRLISQHLTKFFLDEVKQGRLTNSLMPLQAGIGAVANAVLSGFLDSPFEGLTMYSEVLQDSAFELIDAGKLLVASTSSITVSGLWYRKVMDNLERYRKHVVLRPQDVSNAAEVIRRLGVIGINTALEANIYGNVNSTHVNGTHMMNGIGGSGDFARNGRLAIFVTKSIAKDGDISSMVPMVPHVDTNEHDVDVLVTEQGIADLRASHPASERHSSSKTARTQATATRFTAIWNKRRRVEGKRHTCWSAHSPGIRPQGRRGRCDGERRSHQPGVRSFR